MESKGNDNFQDILNAILNYFGGKEKIMKGVREERKQRKRDKREQHKKKRTKS